MTLTLTEQQQAVVGHNHSSALVCASHGAGQTTAGRANIVDLRRALKPWPHCAPSAMILCGFTGMRIDPQVILSWWNVLQSSAY